jgi:maleamate amidohydrolase
MSKGDGEMTTAKQSDAEFFAAKGFGQTMGFGETPALLVVDFLKAFTDPSQMLGSKLDDEIAATNKLLEAAHNSRAPVFFSVVSYEDEDLKDAGIWTLKQRGSVTLRAGSEGVGLDPRLDFRKGDSLLSKKYASCFFGTDFVPRLNTYRADTLIIAGCTTSGCVRASAVDALQNGFRPMIVREAVGDRSKAAHEQSLFDLQAKYADVVSLDETVAYLNAIGHNRRGDKR